MYPPTRLKPDDSPGVSFQDATVNRVELVGYLGQDAELRYTSAGAPVVTLSLATHRWHRDGAGDLVEFTDWHRIVARDELAEVAKDFRRGALVKAVGHLRTRSWEGPRGERRIRTEVLASEVRQIRRGPVARQTPLPFAERDGVGPRLPAAWREQTENVQEGEE